jgi:D-xylose transport system substrate-binding protein
MKQARILLVLGSFVLSVVTGLLLSRRPSDASTEKGKEDKLLIGLSLDTLKEARWQVDKRLFEEQVKALGAETITLSANSDDTTQIGDVEKLITQGIDVLVIVPHDGKAMQKAVELAHQAKIPVIAYDRIIPDSDLDLYVSFDNVKVGELQADFVVKNLKTPGKGKIVRISGSKTDNNAYLFKKGQDNILGPYISRGDIQIIHDDWADDWKPEVAKRIMNAAISSHGSAFDAVLAANDGTAGGAIQALTEENLAGQKLVTGQDAEQVACERIKGGTQTMTIYKPISILAKSAATLAVKLAKHETVVAKTEVDNGKIMVPSVLNDVVVVTSQNLMDTVVKDGFCKL